jgi:hypothetical protein
LLKVPVRVVAVMLFDGVSVVRSARAMTLDAGQTQQQVGREFRHHVQ